LNDLGRTDIFPTLPSSVATRDFAVSMGRKWILYHTNWANYGRNFQVKDIPLKALSDIAYAFFNIKDSGNGNWVITSGDEYIFSIIALIV